ncbi:MAG: arginine--tRNA ligase [Myxococcales bacterium]|nr:arginine--tRNA ligase [Myxococcales bacterium]
MFVTLKERLQNELKGKLEQWWQDSGFDGEPPALSLEESKSVGHGDFACTLALALAKPLKKNPRQIAQDLENAFGDANGLLEKSEIAGPGFLNFFVRPGAWHDTLFDILETGSDFMCSNEGEGERILLEFVSANPTGPLHIAHGRGAVVGDVLASLLNMAGYKATREYYVNDLGNQIDTMARSIYFRYAELYGQKDPEPEDFYPGEYVIDLARAIQEEFKEEFLGQPENQWLEYFAKRGVSLMLERIREDLETFGIHFDHFQSERLLAEENPLDALVSELEERGVVFTQDGKKWFRTTDFGDDKDRVVLREDGRTTYFTSDIAYHKIKFERGAQRLINVFGADHGGYVTRVKAGIAAMGYSAAALDCILVQMVSLSRGGEAVRMGKRAGNAIWLRDVLDEVGKDAIRYHFIMRRADAQMEFDLELATKKSLDNPVYYAQMGHARLCAIRRKAEAENIALPQLERNSLDALLLPEELSLIKTLTKAPEVIAEAANAYEPHKVVYFIQDLIALFHSYYSKYKGEERVISEDEKKTKARLLLCQALELSLKRLLEVLGVSAPEEMYLSDVDQEEGQA